MEFSNELITVQLIICSTIFACFLMVFIIDYASIPPFVEMDQQKGQDAIPNGHISHIYDNLFLGRGAVFTGFIFITVVMGEIGFRQDLTYLLAGLIIMLLLTLRMTCKALPNG